MDARDGITGAPRQGARHALRGLAGRLRCSPAEAVAVSLLVAGAAAGLGLLWVLAAPWGADRPEAPAIEGAVGEDDLVVGASPGAAVEASFPADGTAGPRVAGSPSAELVVHVAGRVVAPGIYRLPSGSRVAEAVERAGGVLGDADVDGVNLARALVDGEQVRVPAVGEQPAPAHGAGPGGQARRADGTLDLNLAAMADLDELPGVGPVLAQRILDHREAVGRYTSVEELRDVAGIGEATYAELAPEVSV